MQSEWTAGEARNGAQAPAPEPGAKTPAQHRRARFQRLAPGRTEKALRAIETLGLCANRRGYDYTADEAHQIVYALGEAVAALARAFTPPEDPVRRAPFALASSRVERTDEALA